MNLKALGTATYTILAIIGALVIGVSSYGYVRSIRTEAVTREISLSAQYLSNQNNLSGYILGFYEQLGIVKYKSDKLDEIITDYVKGRNFSANGQSNRGAFINAVTEAVPDLKGLDIADRMMNYVQSGRESYKNIQDKLLDQLRSYDTWREQGLVRPIVLGNFFPSPKLEARVGGKVVATGMEARNKMYEIVQAEDATNAYKSGTMAPLSVK